MATAALAIEPAAEVDEAAYYLAVDLASRGDFTAASQTLRQFLERNPEHAGAWLDLAIYSCKLGADPGKDDALARLRQAAGTQPLPSLIEELVERLAAARCAPAWAWLAGRKSIRGSAGYARNLNFASAQSEILLPNALSLRLDGRLLPRSSPFAGLEAEWQQPIATGQENLQLAWMLQGAAQTYFQASDYDTQSLVATLLARSRHGPIEGVHSLAYGNLRLGGSPYADSWSLRSYGQFRLGRPTLLGGLGLAATRLDYAQSAFNAVVLEPGAYVSALWSEATLARLEYNLIRDRAVDHRPGGDRNGYSWALEVTHAQSAGRQWAAQFRWTRLHDAAPYLPALFGDEKRDATQRQLRLMHDWQLDSAQRLRLEWRQQWQSDPIDLFAYTASHFDLSWHYVWR